MYSVVVSVAVAAVAAVDAAVAAIAAVVGRRLLCNIGQGRRRQRGNRDRGRSRRGWP